LTDRIVRLEVEFGNAYVHALCGNFHFAAALDAVSLDH
jgi:hypothetical protein